MIKIKCYDDRVIYKQVFKFEKGTIDHNGITITVRKQVANLAAWNAELW